jgi:hypothetical protein
MLEIGTYSTKFCKHIDVDRSLDRILRHAINSANVDVKILHTQYERNSVYITGTSYLIAVLPIHSKLARSISKY